MENPSIPAGLIGDAARALLIAVNPGIEHAPPHINPEGYLQLARAIVAFLRYNEGDPRPLLAMFSPPKPTNAKEPVINVKINTEDTDPDAIFVRFQQKFHNAMTRPGDNPTPPPAAARAHHAVLRLRAAGRTDLDVLRHPGP